MLIRTKDLIKTFGDKTVIEHLNLEVEEGKLLAYIGTNGAGKSTTMKMLTGLLKPTSGEIELAADLKIGMVFQESVLDEELTVLDNLKSRQALYRKQDKAWLEKLIQLTGLDAFLNQTYGTLSGGQRRRVDIVRALLNKPNLLFLDEPTTGLDIQTRRAIWEILHRLQREENLTIFLTTHYLEEAENADMAYIIDHGKVLAKGSAKELKETYSKPYLLVETSDVAAFSDLDCKRLGDGRLKIIVEDSAKALAILSDKRTVINDFDYVKANINDVFLNITGREMA
ncbi:ABC transporter, ATP-binding protein [Streptococcus infantarius subsp. infantarius]|uniref:ABC transporter ATP-binding protein n=1 Tax=Streptococcus infantarius TaxID=102684 RepID=UPI00024DCCF6|nr:ABC transporter ATP-binding protein [Streptococcus infantarius]AEZ63106.1 ABC transporter, ATP-binding protein [Streptococcus infantarius subsp. infantarius CJ18]MCO4640328.1 ABC transporter, ATP-binding protein [Streptococcus infantarius subsp. infantarius]MCO4646506.1 ABC transporter, ATP-binding protein [Streptococcus infantarius subsp. infantarius]MCO4647454.1 ABC transporter, ATP-binding protein [Streptococcus infantarius subsp. infantarius]MCO4649999.1 ABC transporter, ATP-binding pro